MYKNALTVIAWAVLAASMVSCGTAKLPPFSNQRWHVDSTTGNAISDRGMELGFGCEWMLHNDFLIQRADQMAEYPELEKHLATSIAEFP